MDDMTIADEELFEAVENQSPGEVRNLLRRKADIATKNKDGDTVLHLAAWKGRADVIQALTTAENWKEIVDIKDALGRTALHNCCMSENTTSHKRTIKLLLDHGADATETDQDGWTALHQAAVEGHLAAVQCLVKHMMDQNKDCNQKTIKSGVTALHIAADRGFAKIVDALMSNGASKAITAWDGRTVLHWALQGAIWVGHGINTEDKAGDAGGSTDLIDEVMKFDDDGGGSDQRREHSGTKDTPDQHDAVFKRILSGSNGATKWSELLKVARREERMGALQYLMGKMYPRQVADRLRKPLKRIWLAMNETRTQKLMELLWTEACEAKTPELMGKLREEASKAKTQELMERLRTEAHEARTQEQLEKLQKEACDTTESMGKWDSMENWDVLSLATSLGKVQTVYWLLRSRHWPRSDINKAKNLPGYYRLNKDEILSTEDEIWNTPFVHDERSGGESYRWPTDDLERKKLDKFGATIMDFHKVDNQIVSIYYHCGPWSLMDEDHGPRKTMKKSMDSLENQKIEGVVTNEYSDAVRRYRWIHLAINSVPWMKDLAIISYLEKKAKSEEWMATWQFLRRSWQELPENRDEESYMRPNCLRANLSPPESNTGEQLTTPKHDESMRLALYMPYLTFGPFENTPHDTYLADEHEGGILHRSRTLDQFYHSIKDDMRARDKDQVFTRYADRYLRRERKSSDTKFDILRVNQLWLWVIDESTVITSTTHGLDDNEDPVFQGFLKRLCQSQTMFNRETTPSSVDSFVKLITSFYINAMDNLKVSLKAPSAQAMRENLYGPSDVDQAHRPDSTTDSKTDSTKDNKKTHTASLTMVFAESIEHNNEKERNLRQDFREAMNDKTSRSGNLHNAIVQTMNVLDDIKDIRDELNIINSVVQEQNAVWSQLFNKSRGPSTRDDAPKDGHENYQWSNTDPEYVLKRVKDLLQEAEKTEHNITSVLELEMNQLSLSEAEESRMQGKILMAFTIVTVLFLPLSFLASLFALNVSIFPHLGNDVQYQPGWIFGIMFGATLAFILLLLPFTVLREDFGKIVKIIMKHQKQPTGSQLKTSQPEASQLKALQLKVSQLKASQPALQPRDEDTPTAGENGHESWKKWLQKWWGRWKKEKPDGQFV